MRCWSLQWTGQFKALSSHSHVMAMTSSAAAAAAAAARCWVLSSVMQPNHTLLQATSRSPTKLNLYITCRHLLHQQHLHPAHAPVCRSLTSAHHQQTGKSVTWLGYHSFMHNAAEPQVRQYANELPPPMRLGDRCSLSISQSVVFWVGSPQN